MLDILLISLPSKWGRKYVYVENYWMTFFAQWLSSYGYNVSILDAALDRLTFSEVKENVCNFNPKLSIYLVSRKNLDLIYYETPFIPFEQSIFLFDDSFDRYEIDDYNYNNKVVCTQIDCLIKTIHDIFLDKHMNHTSTQCHLVGRTYLKKVLLEGGECEILWDGVENRNSFPSDYVFYSYEYVKMFKNTNMVINEIKTLSRTFGVRKINIIDGNLLLERKKIETILKYFKEHNLIHIKLGVYIEMSMLTERVNDYIIQNKDHFYKVTVFVDMLTPENLKKVNKLVAANIKVKIVFELFHSESTYGYIEFVSEAIKQYRFSFAPITLILGAPREQRLAEIQKIMKYIYMNFFKILHEKIIQAENNMKYELRTGQSQEYDLIEVVRAKNDDLIQRLNSIFMEMLLSLLKNVQDPFDCRNEMIRLLTSFREPILRIKGDIDDYLLTSCRV